MSSELYAILAMAARYWFAALVLAVAFRAWRMTVKDNRRSKLIRDWSTEAGCIGQFVIDPGWGKRQNAVPVPREGVLGASRRADICLKGKDVKRYHFAFEERTGGLLVKPRPKAHVLLNGEYTGEKLFVKDGDTLTVGGHKLLLVLFQVEGDQPFDDTHIWGPAQPQPQPQPRPQPRPPARDQLKAFEDELWPDD